MTLKSVKHTPFFLSFQLYNKHFYYFLPRNEERIMNKKLNMQIIDMPREPLSRNINSNNNIAFSMTFHSGFFLDKHQCKYYEEFGLNKTKQRKLKYTTIVFSFVENLALFRHTDAKYAYLDSIRSEKVVDGKKAKLYYGGGECFFSRNEQAFAFFYVDLDYIRGIERVIVYHRQEQDPWGLYNLVLIVSVKKTNKTTIFLK